MKISKEIYVSSKDDSVIRTVSNQSGVGSIPAIGETVVLKIDNVVTYYRVDNVVWDPAAESVTAHVTKYDNL